MLRNVIDVENYMNIMKKIEHEKYVGYNYNAIAFVSVNRRCIKELATTPIDLCPECMSKLIEFLEEKEK